MEGFLHVQGSGNGCHAGTGALGSLLVACLLVCVSPGSTKPYKFIGFGAMDVAEPYKFMGVGAIPTVLQPALLNKKAKQITAAKRSKAKKEEA